ncbi:unnamed protein product [Effrenium voratum]|nr:unnamed protein product [Effrenium voratum]
MFSNKVPSNGRKRRPPKLQRRQKQRMPKHCVSEATQIPRDGKQRKDDMDSLMSRVVRILKSLTAKNRKKIVSQRLSQRQRLDLEAFMTRAGEPAENTCHGSLALCGRHLQLW